MQNKKLAFLSRRAAESKAFTNGQILPGFEQCTFCKDELRDCVKIEGHWFCPNCREEREAQIVGGGPND